VTQREPETQGEELVEAVHPVEARKWLGVSEPTYNALAKSGLLGRVTDDGYVFWEDLQHYNRSGTQWRTANRMEVTQRMMTAEQFESVPPPPDIASEKAYPGVQTWPRQNRELRHQRPQRRGRPENGRARAPPPSNG
jgi:hypothetical protein